MATTKFFEKMINAVEKVQHVTLDEKIAKADTIVAISQIIGKHNMHVTWNKTKWKVTPR